MASSYDVGTDEITVTGGTNGSPVTVADIHDADQAGTLELLGSTTAVGSVDIGAMLAPRPGLDLALQLTITAQGTFHEDDEILIQGTDASGLATQDNLAIGAVGAGAYDTPHYYKTVTSIGCLDTNNNDWEFKVSQGRWGVIDELIEDRLYRVNCNLAIGNGSDAAYLASVGEMVVLATGKSIGITDNATLRLGERYPDTSDGWGRNGSMWMVDHQFTMVAAGSTSAGLAMYGSTFQSLGNNIVAVSGGTWLARNSIISGNRDANAGSELRTGAACTLDWKRVQVANWGWFRDFGSTKTHFVDVHSHANGYAIRGQGDTTVDRMRITNPITGEVYMYNGTMTLKDPVSNLTGASQIVNQDANAVVVEAYTCNIHVVDAAGEDLSGVTVVCTDRVSSQMFSVETGDDGTIAEQDIPYKAWTGTDEELTECSPHTFTFSKAGYATKVMENVEVSRPIDWRVELMPPKEDQSVRQIEQNESNANERELLVDMGATGLTVTARILKAGASSLADIAGSVSAISGTSYHMVALDAADVDTLGEAKVVLTDAAGSVPTRERTLQVVAIPVVNVTLGAVQAVREPGNRLTSPITLEMFQLAEKAFPFTVMDANGDAVDLSAKTLRFLAHDENNPPNASFKVEGAGIVVSGSSNEVATVTVTATESATAGNYRYELWDVASDEVLVHGPLTIRPAAKDTA